MSGVAFATSLPTRCSAAGIRPAMAGNFSLTRQRKVTKRGALNAIRTRAAARARDARIGPCPHATRCALAAVPITSAIHRTTRPLNARPHAGLTRKPKPASLGRRDDRHRHRPRRRPSDAVVPDKPGVQPALTVVKQRSVMLVTGTAARAQRVASGRHATGCFRAPLLVSWCWCAVQGLFFGDFLLAPQKKVTRPPGRTPGNAPSRHVLRISDPQA